MFSPKHLIILFLSIALIVGLVFATRKWNLEKKYKAFLAVALVSETVKVFFYILDAEPKFGGILPKIDLPFHLCSIQIIFTMIYVFCKSEKIKRTIAVFMMPSGLVGGFAAVLIPAYPALDAWVITFQYFLYHCALISLSTSILLSRELKFTVNDYKTCLIFVFGLMFFSFYINSILYNGGGEDINFMYVASPPQEGLPYLTEEHGWGVYITHYAILILTVVTLFYIKPIIAWLKAKFTKKDAVN